jgi:DNA mismatch repair protein MutL
VVLNSADCNLVQDLESQLHLLGFTIDSFGGNDLVINGIPPEAEGVPIQHLLENMLEQYKHSSDSYQNNSRERLARSMARSLSAKEGKAMRPIEMMDLIDRLFACNQPQTDPSGKPTIVTLTLDDLLKKFKS